MLRVTTVVYLATFVYICENTFVTMDKRLEQFLSAEGISQSQFADTIGVARASVSHIIAGRNRPGFDFIENMARSYPSLNLEWLITGQGEMYKTGDLFSSIPLPSPSTSPAASPTMISKQTESTPHPDLHHKQGVSKIIVFYDDGTYQELK